MLRLVWQGYSHVRNFVEAVQAEAHLQLLHPIAWTISSVNTVSSSVPIFMSLSESTVHLWLRYEKPRMQEAKETIMAKRVQLGLSVVYLPSGVIVNTSTDRRDEFTLSELKLFLFLLEKAITFPHSYLPSWYLARSVFPDKYHRHRDNAIHAVKEHLSGMRKKLGEKSYHPQYLIGSRDKGYRLYLPKGCAAVPVETLRSLFDKLKSR